MDEYPLTVRLRPRRALGLPAPDLTYTDRQAAEAKLLSGLGQSIGQILLRVETCGHASGLQADIASGTGHEYLLRETVPIAPQ
jgi:hypothetical protein